MTDQLFDRYKDALRAGHVAVLRGRLDEALAAYRVAAEIAPTRPLPHTSMGGVLLDLGEVDEALEELRIALELAPGDEGALLGRAEALARARRPAEAAASLDKLADSQLDTGRTGAAVETLQRALMLEERVGRRRKYQRAVRSLRMQSGERLPDGLAGRSLASLEAVEAAEPPAEAAEPPAEVEAPATAEAPDEAAEAAEALAEAEAPEAIVEEAPEPEAPPVPPEPRIAGESAVAEAEAAAARGDAAEAIGRYLEAARTFEDAGLTVAALDACRDALALAPGDIDVHLRYASACRSRGWRELAQVRMLAVLRLAELQGDDAGRARVRAVIEASYADDEELMRLSA